MNINVMPLDNCHLYNEGELDAVGKKDTDDVTLGSIEMMMVDGCIDNTSTNLGKTKPTKGA